MPTKEWKEVKEKYGEPLADVARFMNNSQDVNLATAGERLDEYAREVMGDIEVIPHFDKNDLAESWKENGDVMPEQVLRTGTNDRYYQVVNERLLDDINQINENFGPVIESTGSLIRFDDEAIKKWNQLATEQLVDDIDVDQSVKNFIARMGIDVKTAEDLLEKHGAYGIAHIAEKLISLQAGKEKVALTEEAIHFFVEMMPQDHEDMIGAMDEITNHDVYRQTLAQYKDNKNYQNEDGTVRFDKIQKEALGKAIASVIINKVGSKRLIDKIKAFFQKLIDFIKTIPVRRSNIDKLADLFVQGRYEQLDRNISTNEIYNQLPDEEKDYYLKQGVTEAQKETIGKIYAAADKNRFDEKEHQHYYFDEITRSETAIPSGTGLLGSDFDSALDDPEILERVYYLGHLRYPGMDAVEIAEAFVQGIIDGDFDTAEIGNNDADLRTILDTEAMSRRKTLFGTFIHNLVEDYIKGKPLDMSEIDSTMATPEQVHDLLYGTHAKRGIFDYIKDLQKDGHVIMTEVAVANENMGGIIDIIAIDKDGKAQILDFKTKYLRTDENYAHNKKSIESEFDYVTTQVRPQHGVYNSEHVLPQALNRKPTKAEKWSQQMTLYKKVLMEAGVPVGNITVIGVPYRLNEDGKIREAAAVWFDKTKYDKDFANHLFGELDPDLETTTKKKEPSQSDKEAESIGDLSRDTIHSSFVKSFAVLQQLFKHYSKSKDKREVYKYFETHGETNGNDFGALKSEVESFLRNFNTMQNDATMQKSFIRMVNDSIGVLNTMIKQFEDVRNTIPADAAASGQKLATLASIRNFAVGLENMYRDIVAEVGKVDAGNPIMNRISHIRGKVADINTVYLKTIQPMVSEILGKEFEGDLLNNMRQSYYELMDAAKKRGDEKEVEILQKELDALPTADVIAKLMSGDMGDSNYFFSNFLSTIANPDAVVAGLAKRLKSVINTVRQINIALRDRFATQFHKRKAIMGNPSNLKTFSKGLYRRDTTIHTETGEEHEQMYLVTQWTQKLRTDEDRLIHALKNAIKEGDAAKVKAAKADLEKFQREFLQPDNTEAYYNATAMLDEEVEHNGKTWTVREIVQDVFDRMRYEESSIGIQNMQEGTLSQDEQDRYDLLWEEYHNLFSPFEDNGILKTGDAKRISEILQESRKAKAEMYTYVEVKGLFEKRRLEIALKYGEDSEEYERWYALNTREIVTDAYYTRQKEIFDRIKEITGSEESDELNELYLSLRQMVKAYRDNDGTIQGQKLNIDLALTIKQTEEQIDALRESLSDQILTKSGMTREEQRQFKSGDPQYSHLKRDAYDRTKTDEFKELMALNDELFKMKEKKDTEYYQRALAAEMELFAESRGITLNEVKQSKELMLAFQESDWFVKNHHIKAGKKLIRKTGKTVDATDIRPIFIWKKVTPINKEGATKEEKYVDEVPTMAYYKRTLKESYTDENGNEIKLINKDNRDFMDRLKPKSMEDYRAEYGKDHPYLDQEYMGLKRRYESGTASAIDKQNFEDITMLAHELEQAESQVEITNRLGYAIAFKEKEMYDRIIEDGAKEGLKHSKVGSLWSGVARMFKKVDTDIDRGMSNGNDISRLATIDNDQVKFVPVRFTSKGDIGDQSYDVFGSILEYVASINKKVELDKELALVSGLEEILSEKGNQPKSTDRNSVLNKVFDKYLPEAQKYTKFINKKGSNYRLDTIRTYINAIMYGEEERPGMDIKITDQTTLNTQKLIGAMMGFTSKTAFYFAPFNWATNYINGNVATMLESISGQMFNGSDFRKSNWVLLGTNGKYPGVIKNLIEDVDKLGNKSFWGQLMDQFEAIQGEFENEYGEKTSWSKRRNIFNMLAMSGKIYGEWEVQARAFVSFLLAHRVDNGKLVNRETFVNSRVPFDSAMSVREREDKKLLALKEFAQLGTNFIDILELKDGKIGVKAEHAGAFSFQGKQFHDMVSQLHYVQKKINGNFAKQDKTAIERTSVGKVMIFFRKHIIPMALNRWSPLNNNYEGMTAERGFYVTFWKTAVRDLRKLRIRALLTGANYDMREKAAIRKTLAEVSLIMASVAAMAFMFGFSPDDPDRFKKLKQKGWLSQSSVLLLSKLKSESEQFIPTPDRGLGELKRLWQNPTVLFRNITQTMTLANLGRMQAMHGVGLTEENVGSFWGVRDSNIYYQHDADEGTMKDKGDSKFWASLAGTFGYSGKTYHPIDILKGLEVQNR